MISIRAGRRTSSQTSNGGTGAGAVKEGSQTCGRSVLMSSLSSELRSTPNNCEFLFIYAVHLCSSFVERNQILRLEFFNLEVGLTLTSRSLAAAHRALPGNAGAYVNRTSLCLGNHSEEAGKMKNARQVLRPFELFHATWREARWYRCRHRVR